MCPLRVPSTMGRMPRRPLPHFAVVTQVGIGRNALGANPIPITRLVDSTRYCPNSRCDIRYERDTFWDSSTTTTGFGAPLCSSSCVGMMGLLKRAIGCPGQVPGRDSVFLMGIFPNIKLPAGWQHRGVSPQVAGSIGFGPSLYEKTQT